MKYWHFTVLFDTGGLMPSKVSAIVEHYTSAHAEIVLRARYPKALAIILER